LFYFTVDREGRSGGLAAIWKSSIQCNIINYFGLNITLVCANMPRLSFGACKNKIMKSVLAKFSVFYKSPWAQFSDDLADFCLCERC